ITTYSSAGKAHTIAHQLARALTHPLRLRVFAVRKLRSMKALFIDAPNSIALRDVPEPPLEAGECRVDVRIAGVCRTDLELARGYMNFAGIPGHEFVGTVREGPERLIGRRVVGEINAACGRCQQCLSGMGRHCPQRTVLGIY